MTNTTMKAFQFVGKDKPPQVNEVPIPTPKEGEILVKIKAASLCQSDLIPYHIDLPGGIPVRTLGHEACGEVAELGPGVTGFEKGERVGFMSFRNLCRTCQPCKVHAAMFCQSSKRIDSSLSADGFFAEYAIVDPNATIKISEDIPAPQEAVWFCAGITGYNAVAAAGENDKSLAVIGCGGVGQYAIRVAHAKGLKVFAVDVSPGSLESAKKAGADVIIDSSKLSNEEITEKIKAETDGQGADSVAVIASVGAAYETAKSVVKFGGNIIVVGLPHSALSFNPIELSMRKYIIKGANLGDADTLTPAVRFLEQNRLVSDVEEYPIDEAPTMFEKMKSGGSSKRMVIVF